MSHDKASGGVGLHDISTRNKAFGGKLVWKMYTKYHAKWCSIMQEKYLDSPSPSKIFTVSNPPLGSAIWNFMMSSKDIVCNYVTLEIHSGEKVKFWEDSWNGFPPLCRQEKLDEACQVLKAEWGSSFWDYVFTIEIHSRRVLWKEPPTHLPSQPSLLSLRDFLAERIFFLSNREDIVIWAPTKGGDYSIKEHYYGLRKTYNSRRKCRAFSFCWNSNVLPKAGCFAWLALRKRILTSEWLSRLCIAESFICKLCNKELESIDHLLLQCPFAYQCWVFVLNKLQMSLSLPNSLWDLFQS